MVATAKRSQSKSPGCIQATRRDTKSSTSQTDSINRIEACSATNQLNSSPTKSSATQRTLLPLSKQLSLQPTKGYHSWPAS